MIHNTLPVAAQGAADLERPAGEAPPPPRQGCSVCRLWLARVHPGCNTAVFGVVRELLGSLGVFRGMVRAVSACVFVLARHEGSDSDSLVRYELWLGTKRET